MKRKLKSKIVSALLVSMLIIGLLPTTVFAAAEGELWINGVDIITAKDHTVACGSGTAVYDSEGKTLTLTNATMETASLNSRIIDIPNNSELTILLVGENVIQYDFNAFYAGTGSNVTISGSGSLTINTVDSSAIYSDGALTVDQATVNVTTQNDGAVSIQDCCIQNGAKVTAKGSYYGVMASKFSINKNSTLKAISTASECNALNVYGAEGMLVSNSTVTAETTSDRSFPAIYVAGNINVTDKSNVDATSSGMRGIFTDSDMTVTDSTVTATGTTHEGMVVVGTLNLTNSKLTASSKPDDYIPAIVTKNFNIVGSEVVANGGFDLFDWSSGDTDGISLSITPANGKLAEFKVDGDNWNGSAAKHFEEGSESPYDTAINFSANEMNWLGAYRYIHIGEHIHTGGTATCELPAICEDCGKAYGTALGHSAVKTEAKAATCTEDGNKEYWYCEACGKYFSDEALTKEITKEETVVKATGHGETELKNAKKATCTAEGYTGDKVCKVCGEVVEKGKVTAKTAHNFKDGKCTVCKTTDPKYVPTKPTVTDKGNTNSPQTGDSTNIALWLTVMLMAGTVLTGTALYSKKRKHSK